MFIYIYKYIYIYVNIYIYIYIYIYITVLIYNMQDFTTNSRGFTKILRPKICF